MNPFLTAGGAIFTADTLPELQSFSEQVGQPITKNGINGKWRHVTCSLNDAALYKGEIALPSEQDWLRVVETIIRGGTHDCEECDQ